jgi:hypothetical protein
MKKQIFIRFGIFLVLMAVLVSGASRALASGVVTTDAIAGTWYGNMHFSDRNDVERIQFVIPAGCQPGSVCGTMLNYPAQCIWEITYDGYASGAYLYHFSNTLKGGCVAGSSGSLTLLSDGSLYRVHTTPIFTSSGSLNKLPNAGN